MYTPGDGFDDDGPGDEVWDTYGGDVPIGRDMPADPFECPDQWHDSRDDDGDACPTCGYVVGGDG